MEKESIRTASTLIAREKYFNSNVEYEIIGFTGKEKGDELECKVKIYGIEHTTYIHIDDIIILD